MRVSSAIAVVSFLSLPAVARTESREQYNWVMHCQGCHGAEAQGAPGSVPRMAGTVGLFLNSADGRAYLGRVPGVAFVNLSDSAVADLLNWVVRHFDGAHLPKPFKPYSEEEVSALRRDPLISKVYEERQRIVRSLPGK